MELPGPLTLRARGPHSEAAGGGAAIEQLSRAVNQRLPDFNLGAKDLAQNPKFTKLLMLLTDHLDRTGLSLTVKRDLEKARRELRKQKQEWLRAEALQRILNEMVTEYHINRWENPVRPGDRQFFETLEQCQVLARCCRQLDARESERADAGPPLLGLERQHLQDLLPEALDIQAMRQRLVPEVEKRLRERCFTVLCYYRPEYENNSEVLKMAKCGAMTEMFEADKQRQQKEQDKNRENQIAITNQTFTYLTVLYRCFEMLRQLIERHRLDQQPEIDQELQDYLKLKSKAMFTKLGLMRLELRHQLFNQDTVAAHNCIRTLLLEELEAQQQSDCALRGTLSLYQMLGTEFEELVAEYGRLREVLENKRWALAEFSKSEGSN
ncbi:HAUS augmin-like complex subunit 4 [Heterodontus francisci]|uniref:HAUS augmin-like complex subunit 4 n=1 Tax=Heterodontus francisci TaxID=7792 RepID=UPI00355C7CD5